MVAFVQVTLHCPGRDDREHGPRRRVTPVERAECEQRAAAALARVRIEYRGRPRALIQRAIGTALTDTTGGTLTGADLARAATAIHHGHYVTVDVRFTDPA